MKLRTLVVFALLLSTQAIGCKKGADVASTSAQVVSQPETPESEIRTAIRAHLAHKGNLNLQAFDTNVQQVNIQGDKAEAKVAFQLKNGPGVMELTYRLEKNGGTWAVVDSQPTGSDFSHPPPGLKQNPVDDAPPGGSHSLADTLRNFREAAPESPSK